MTTPRIVVGLPPNYAQICAEVGTPPLNAVYAWEGTIFSPAGDKLPFDLIEHEKVHFEQQKAIGGAWKWWNRYLTDKEFRLEQEVEAYQAQIAWHQTRADRLKCWRQVSNVLSASLYGWLCTPEQARRLLRDAVA
jgi:hypothetical protein